jgi:PAS domain S-box-containing protein
MTIVNPTWCQMLGYSQSELLGKNILDVTHPDDHAHTLAVVQQMAQGGPNFAINKRYLRKDGSTLWAVSSVCALRDAQGAYQGLGAIVLDVSAHKQAEAALQSLAADLAEADRCKSEFLATLSHELRNPLSPLSHALQMMRMAPDNPSVVLQAQGIMERQLGIMVQLVDELLDIARVSRGKIVLRKQAIDLHEVISSAVETSAGMMQAGQHRLKVTCPDEPLRVFCDPTRMSQVLSNLLNNAAKYTPNGGRIALGVTRENDWLVIEVRDTGVGIDEDVMPQIFDMFKQVGRSLERSQGGLGVGLSLARTLVELHGGTLAATSPGLGAGSTVTVKLPVAGALNAPPGDAPRRLDATPEIDRAPAPAESETAPPRPFRILVVDDNVDGATTLALVLQMLGHITEVAYDGPRAIEAATHSTFDLVFLDIGMPGMNGYDTARAMRQLPVKPGAPPLVLVALTGWGSEEDRLRATEAGFDLHLIKPADIAAIEALLNGLA